MKDSNIKECPGRCRKEKKNNEKDERETKMMKRKRKEESTKVFVTRGEKPRPHPNEASCDAKRKVIIDRSTPDNLVCSFNQR